MQLVHYHYKYGGRPYFLYKCTENIIYFFQFFILIFNSVFSLAIYPFSSRLNFK